MTSQTVSSGNIYRLTLTVDEAFLTDPDTVYPVSIDPELKVSDNTHGSGAIEDVNIYSGAPNATANWSYMHVGYYDSTYQTGRILVRLRGLIDDDTFQDLTASQIKSAFFILREATGKAAAEIELWALTGSTTWTESGATWSNCGVTTSTMITSVNHGQSTTASYNIKSLIQAWVSGATNPERGFLLCHADEDNATKGFYSSEFSTTSYRPYVTVTYAEPEAEAEVYLSSSSISVREGQPYTLTATTSPSGQTVTWTSSNDSVASVNSSGKITANKAGVATITVTLSNGATDSCMVYVHIANGVYLIENYTSTYLMAPVDARIYSGTSIYQRRTSTDTQAQLSQMWKIAHLGNCVYSIRPMHYPVMGLYNIGGSVSIQNIGTSDSMSSVSAYAQWTIIYDTNGYVIRNQGSNSYTLCPSGGATTEWKSIVATADTGANYFHWKLTKQSNVPDHLLLYNSSGILCNGEGRIIDPDETLTLGSLGFTAVFSSATVLNQSLTWSSSNPTAVSVNATTGAITANTPGGEAIITVQKTYNGTTYSRYYRVYVSGAQEGSYYIRNKGLDSYMQLDDNASNDFTVSGIIMELWPYNDSDYQKWILTDLGNGYYKITSARSGLALSVLSDYVNTDGMFLVQEAYIGADRQRWKLDRTESGSYVLRPKSAEGYDTDWCMCAGTESGTDGYNVEQKAYIDNSDSKDEWCLDTYTLTLNLYYDNAFLVRHADASLLIHEFSPELQDYCWEIFNLRLNINSPQQILSTPDMCKLNRNLTITTDTIDAMCPANPVTAGECDYFNQNRANDPDCENCTSWFQIYRDFISEYTGSNIATSVLFTGSALYNDDGAICNRSYQWYDNGLILQNIASSSEDYYNEVFSTYVHELSHAIGAIDHYHEWVENSDGIIVCSAGENCIQCNPSTGRPAWCLMGGDGKIDDPTNYNKSTVYCPDCLNDILEHLADHHISIETGG